MNKPFILFVGGFYYPAGGWRDLGGQFETLEEAKEKGVNALNEGNDWWHVVDVRTSEIVAEY